MSAASKGLTEQPENSLSAQPFLHDSSIVLHAPTVAVSRPDGQIRTGVDGYFHGDLRAISRFEVTTPGVVAEPVHGEWPAENEALFRTVLRVGQHTADPVVVLSRHRRVRPARIVESLALTNSGIRAVSLTVLVTVESDGARMELVKAGGRGAALPATPGVDRLSWRSEGIGVLLSSNEKPTSVSARDGRLAYRVTVPPGGRWDVELTVEIDAVEAPEFLAVSGEQPWQRVSVRSADDRFVRLLDRAQSDLRGMRLGDPGANGDRFLAAGAPWFLTLFGRDSLWAARMLLPLGTELAGGTLRALARRQGRAVDVDTGEQPGKILHEVRQPGVGTGDVPTLPTRYYGTVDATPLWLILLHEAWRWGMPPAEVESLLDTAEAALSWMADYGDPDGDGLLEYIDRTGRGLANQGWKDSGDSIRWRDGTLASPPIVLSEVQAYAYQAATGGAALLRAFGRPGADRWDGWAHRVRERFRALFWLEDDRGPYTAVALDADKRPVDAVTSTFGHLIGSGLLDEAESAALAGRLAGADAELDTGFGVRTLSPNSVGFNPLGYHIGSVWPHDTAIAVHGLSVAGFPEAAASLVNGLVNASVAFDARLPELFCGDTAGTVTRPAPYPAACRPQAWSAAASVFLLRALLGLDADVPGGTITVNPMPGARQFPLTANGLLVAGRELSIAVAADGTVRVDAPDGLSVRRG